VIYFDKCFFQLSKWKEAEKKAEFEDAIKHKSGRYAGQAGVCFARIKRRCPGGGRPIMYSSCESKLFCKYKELRVRGLPVPSMYLKAMMRQIIS
jgi:hypothetical protein